MREDISTKDQMLLKSLSVTCRFSSIFYEKTGAAQAWFFGAVVVFAWSSLVGQMSATWLWLGPGLLLAAWSTANAFLHKRQTSARAAFTLATGAVAIGAILPTWPGVSTPLMQAYVIVVAMLAPRATHVLARLAHGPKPGPEEKTRVFLLIIVVLITWWAYFTPQIVGVVDERWYGDLMEDFLGQTRNGIFPVFVGQGEFAWNGNSHPFRSAPWHHNFGALLDVITLRKLTPLAVQHIVLIASILAAVAVIYVGLRRLRPACPWFAWLVAFFYATCPALTMPQIQHDMYMTTAAMPIVALIVISLGFALETRAWRAWIWLGAGLGAVWFCHPPVAFLTSANAALVILFWSLMRPLEARTLRQIAITGLVSASMSAGYFVSIGEFSNLRVGLSDPVPHVVVPGTALVCIVLGLTGCYRYRQPAVWGLAAGGVVMGVEALAFFLPAILVPVIVFIVVSAALLALAHFKPRLGLMPFPDLMIISSALAVGIFFGLRLPAFPEVDPYLEGLRGGYKLLWVSLHQNGNDQLGYAVAVGLVLALITILRRPHPAAQAFLAVTIGLILALAPVPGLCRLIWYNAPKEITDVIGFAYFLRFMPVTAPFALVAIFLALGRNFSGRTYRWSTLALIGFIPWAMWENSAVVGRSWQFRESAAQTQKHLISENRALSRFHYDLLPYSNYHNNGVADFRIETRLWWTKPGPNNRQGPDETAAAMARAQNAAWIEPVITQDPNYPSWLYLTPKLILAPGERKLVTFEWATEGAPGWLIARGKKIYREYILPEAAGNLSFGDGAEHHHTLSFWNSGAMTEEIELVLKREGTLAKESLKTGEKPVRFRVVEYQPAVAPVEVLSLQPLQLRVRAEHACTVETFRTWQPGYRVSVDEQPVRVFRSPNGLVAFQVPAGSHLADVRFRGTPELRVAAKWSLLMGGLFFAAVFSETVRLARRANSTPPGGDKP
jgi:hypothetical protein